MKAEAIALPIPTWSIETWLLELLDEQDVNESQKLKGRFGHRKSVTRGDIQAAAGAWSTDGSDLPSLTDGHVEFQRIG